MLLKSRFVTALMAFAFFPRQVTGQNVTGQNVTCYSSLDTLDEDERSVTDIEVVRTYILCANTTFITGFVTTDGEILGGQMPLTLRKNMHVYCGDETGSSANNCIIYRGSFGLTSLPANFDPPTVNTGVIVQGVTFDNAALFGMLLQLAGEFKFIDCIYSNNRAGAAVVAIEWDGGSIGNATSRNLEAPTGRYSYTHVRESRQSKQVKQKEQKRALQTATTLKIEFIDCVFLNNTCVDESFLSAVSISLNGTNITFTNCVFENNNFAVPGVNDANFYGVLIENNSFGPLAINSSCFINNKAYGNALVATYGDELGTMTNNYGLNNTVVWTTDLECTFAALVDASYSTVECSEFDATTCARRPALPPSPVLQPTSVPSPTAANLTDAPAPSPRPFTPPIAAPTPATDTPTPVSQPSAPEAVMTLAPTSSASNIRVAPIIVAAVIIAIMT